MAWQDIIVIEAWPQYLAIVGMLALSVMLLLWGRDHPAGTVFATLLMVRAASMLSATMASAGTWILDDPTATAFWSQVTPWFLTPLPLLMAYFMMVYPAPRAAWVRGRGPIIVLAAATAAFLALYLYDPTLWNRQIEADGRYSIVPIGPLSFLLGLYYILVPTAGWVLARDARRLTQRTNVHLVATAFIITGLFDGLGALVYFLQTRAASPNLLMAAAASVPAIGGALTLARSPDMHLARWSTIGSGLAVAAVSLVYFDAYMPADVPLSNLALLGTGLVRLAVPALASYALLRHGLFDIDLRAKLTLERGSMGAVVAGLFFVVSEVVEQFLPAGTAWGNVLAAVAIFVVLRPLYGVVRRLIDRAMPTVDDSATYLTARRLDVYSGLVETIYRDGRVTDRERRILDRARTSLGISDQEAARLESLAA